MGVTRVDVTPGVDDCNDRLALVVGSVEAHLRSARTMTERAKIGRSVPPVTTELLRLSASHGDDLSRRARGSARFHGSGPGPGWWSCAHRDAGRDGGCGGRTVGQQAQAR